MYTYLTPLLCTSDETNIDGNSNVRVLVLPYLLSNTKHDPTPTPTLTSNIPRVQFGLRSIQHALVLQVALIDIETLPQRRQKEKKKWNIPSQTSALEVLNREDCVHVKITPCPSAGFLVCPSPSKSDSVCRGARVQAECSLQIGVVHGSTSRLGGGCNSMSGLSAHAPSLLTQRTYGSRHRYWPFHPSIPDSVYMLLLWSSKDQSCTRERPSSLMAVVGGRCVRSCVPDA